MARVLETLSKHPKPLLLKMQLDKQPDTPLLQRVFSRLPKRRPGERYAIKSTPHAFLAYQPTKPLLGGLSWGSKPRISMQAWRKEAPLAFLAKTQGSLLGNMDSHRVPGIITSALLLGLALLYLSGLGDQPDSVVATAEPAAATEAVPQAASEAGETVVASEEDATPEPIAVVEVTDTTEAPATEKAEASKPKVTIAPPAPAKPKVTIAAPTEPAEEKAAEPAKPETAAPEPAKAVVKKEAPETQTAAPTKAKTAAKPAPVKEQAPIYYTEQRSLAILTEARYLYLIGEGPVAVERVALAVEAGHIKPEFTDRFRQMQADIEALLTLYTIAMEAKGNAERNQAFLNKENAVFPGKTSAYAKRLPEVAATEPAVKGEPTAGATTTPEEDNTAVSEPEAEAEEKQVAPKGLQPPEPETEEERPH